MKTYMVIIQIITKFLYIKNHQIITSAMMSFIIVDVKKIIFLNLNVFMFKFTVILFVFIYRTRNIFPPKFPFFPNL